jgi:DNA-binding response OmpR family regulator
MKDTISVLVVADDQETCMYLSKILSAKNWQADEAWVASRALELARQHPYDAIVFDYREPGLEGADICRRIREVQPDAPHVFVTGQQTVDTVYRAVEAGADRVLAKPVEPSDLVHAIEERLGAPT